MSVTRQEVVNMIEEALAKSLGRLRETGGGGNSTYVQLREAREAREAQETRDREREKEQKRQRRESKRLQESGREVFESLGMSSREAKFAAKGRPEFRG
jgi:hypothetical protein